METTLTVQVCNLCESTDVQYFSNSDTFICNTCGQHMTEQQTAIKHLSKTGKVLQGFILFFLLLFALPGKSQFITYKDTAISLPIFKFTIPVVNQSIVTMQADTLQLDSNVIKYIKVKGGPANSLTKLLNPIPINPVIDLLQNLLDTIKIKFGGQSLYYFDVNAIPVGYGNAYKLPVNKNNCLVDTSLLTALNSVDSTLYYLDAKSGILKAKTPAISAPTASKVFVNTDVKKK